MTGGKSKMLVVMRHAKSSWTSDVEDHERPLSSRGRRDGLAAGRMLAELRIAPDLVLCSTAARARATFERAVEGGARYGEVAYADDLYTDDAHEIAARIRTVDPDVDTLLVVGHNPGLVHLIADIAQRTPSTAWNSLDERFPTSAIAVVEIPGDWERLGQVPGTLESLAIPRG